jgi:hypothetical protein
MSAREREVDAWHMRWVVHACVIAVLLIAALSIGVVGRLDEASQLPSDRPLPSSRVPISGPGPAPAGVTSGSATAGTPQTPVNGR